MDADVTGWERYREQISSLSKLDFNYDVKTYHETKDKSGWNVDRHHALLTVEPAGEPVSNGAFESVCDCLRRYKFPDPKLISVAFDPSSDLRGRNILMHAHFAGFTFTFGVRVTGVIDEVRVNQAGHEARVWGYSYRTLKGHFEIGEITFEVSKDLVTGVIEFEINSYSRPDRIPNLFFRIGFILFGRMLQSHFAHSSMKRLREVAERALAASGTRSQAAPPEFTEAKP
ncbi:DUF1990 domain-containing protein [soil metagenome]